MKPSRTRSQSVSAELSHNLDSALAFGSALQSAPMPEMRETLDRVRTLVDYQASRLRSQKALRPLLTALDAPPSQRQPLLDKLRAAPAQVDGLMLGDASCPLAMLPRSLVGLPPQARRHQVALQMLVKSKFSLSCIEALLRKDPQREMDSVLIIVASHALYLRAHAKLLDVPMERGIYTALLDVVQNIWLGGVNPDQHVNNTQQGFDGSLIDQAIALGDIDAVLMLLESKWEAVNRTLTTFDNKHQGDTAFTMATPFMDPWLDTIIDSPLRRTNPNGMAQLARALVAGVGKLMQSRSVRLRQHFCDQVLIRAASCKDVALFQATLEGLAAYNSYGDKAELRTMLQFCVLACWPEGVELMLEHGVHPDTRLTPAWMVLPAIAIGPTALSLAACCDNPKLFAVTTRIIELLLKYGADPRVSANRATQGFGAVLLSTPLHTALEVGNKDAASLLLTAEIRAPKQFATQDRQKLLKLHRLLRSAFQTKRGADVVPTDDAMTALAASYCSATMDNFHIQAGVDKRAWPRFEEVGQFSIRLAEYIDPIETCPVSRARKKANQASFCALQSAARKMIADWPAPGAIALPSEFEPETSLEDVQGAELLSSKSVNESINSLLTRYITLGDPKAAQLFLDLYPATATRHLCMSAAFIIRRGAHKDRSQTLGAVYGKLLDSIVRTICEPHGIRILLEMCCLLEAPTALKYVLNNAQSRAISWQSAGCKGLHRNVLHLAVNAPEGMLSAILGAIPQARRIAWLTQQDEQGDTPLHIAARTTHVAFKPILDGFGDELRCDIENMAGRCVATEALLHGHLDLYETIAHARSTPVESRVFGQAIVAQPRARRLSFIRSLERRAQLTAERPGQLDAVFAHVIARSDAHALRTLVDCYTPYVTESGHNRNTVLHMAAQRAAAGMVQHLRNSLSTTDFERLARCRDDANCYPEDYTEDPQLHRYLRALRKRARNGVVVALEFKHLQTLTPLVDAIATAEKIGCRDTAVQAFVRQAEALVAHKDMQAIDREALGLLSWQVLDMLAGAPGPGCGAHYSAHRPDVSLQQLLKRFDAFGSQGASRFGSDDALTLLRLRRQALELASTQQKSEPYAPPRMIFELADPRLKGEGYVRNQTSGRPIAYEKSPYVRFIIEAGARGLTIVSCYPIAEITTLPAT